MRTRRAKTGVGTAKMHIRQVGELPRLSTQHKERCLPTGRKYELRQCLQQASAAGRQRVHADGTRFAV